ncbi:MAG TPA: zinc ribbon domain-containing protein [Thermoplasmata archaeon]
MADPGTDPMVAVALILFAVALGVLSFLEMRFFRKRMKNRRLRTAKRDDELTDEAHNAIVTTKAILLAMQRQGIRSEESADWLREAETASARRNYRVAVDLTAKAKQRLLALKSAQSSKGDLVKLERLPRSTSSEEVTTKELIQKEFPPNLMQSKFSIEVATTAIEAAGATGRDLGQATQLLDAAKARFDAKDYTGSLGLARQSKRAADGESVDVAAALAAPPAAQAATSACPNCGAALHGDDAFCRKCGTRLVASACASCGASLVADDEFCRKCGAPVSR